MRAYFLWILILLCTAPLSAAEGMTIDKKAYEKATSGYDYTETYEPKQEEVKEEAETNPGAGKLFATLISVLRLLLIAGFIALIVFLIYQFIGKQLLTPNPVNSPLERMTDLGNLEEKLQETALEPLLEQALKEGAYTLAIRIYYLMLIKKMDQKKWIAYRKNKTNAEYLHELVQAEFKPEFRRLTRHYEKTWYGDIPLSYTEFSFWQAQFRSLIEKVA